MDIHIDVVSHACAHYTHRQAQPLYSFCIYSPSTLNPSSLYLVYTLGSSKKNSSVSPSQKTEMTPCCVHGLIDIVLISFLLHKFLIQYVFMSGIIDCQKMHLCSWICTQRKATGPNWKIKVFDRILPTILLPLIIDTIESHFNYLVEYFQIYFCSLMKHFSKERILHWVLIWFVCSFFSILQTCLPIYDSCDMK